MEEEDVKKEMAKRLVSTMDPDAAKGVLLKVIDGDDLYAAILERSDRIIINSDKPPLPKRRFRRTKKEIKLQEEGKTQS